MEIDMLINLLSGSLGALFLYLYQQIGESRRNKRMRKNLCAFIIADLSAIISFLQSEMADKYISFHKVAGINSWKNVIPQMIQFISPDLAAEAIDSYISLQLIIETIMEQDEPIRKETCARFSQSQKAVQIITTIDKIRKYSRA